MASELACPQESLRSLNLHDILNGRAWEPGLPLIESYDKSDGQQKSVITGYKKFFGKETKVLILQEQLKLCIQPPLVPRSSRSDISVDKLNTSVSFDTFSVSSHKPTTKSKSGQLSPHFLRTFTTIIPDESYEKHDKDISDANVIVQLDEEIQPSKSENIYKTIDNIKQGVVSSIYKRSRHLKLGLLITTAVICILITVILIETRKASVDSFNLLSNLFSVAVLRTSIANLTLLAEELYLIDRGYSFNRPRETVQEMINTLGKTYKSIFRDMYDIGDSGFLDEYITAPNQTYWEYENGKYINRPASLMNIMKEITIKCDSLSTAEHIDYDNEDFLELYRNGSDNWYKLMHETVIILVDYNNWSADAKFAVIQWLTIAIGILGTILIVSIIAVPYILLYKVRKSIWDAIFSIKRTYFISGEIKARERLSFLYNDELEVFERKPNIHKISIYRAHRGFLILVLLLLFMLLGLFGFLFHYNNSYINKRIKLVDDASYYYNLSGLHRSNLYRSIFFLRQISLQESAFKELPQDFDPYTLLDDSLNTIRKVHSDNLGVTQFSSVIYDGFFKHRDDGYFTYGMYSLSIELIQSFGNIAQSLREGKDYFEIGMSTESVAFEYCDRLLEVLIGNIEKGSYSIIDSQYAYSVSTNTVYMISMLIYTVVILFSVVSYVRNIILTEFHILTILPIYDTNQIIGILRSI